MPHDLWTSSFCPFVSRTFLQCSRQCIGTGRWCDHTGLHYDTYTPGSSWCRMSQTDTAARTQDPKREEDDKTLRWIIWHLCLEKKKENCKIPHTTQPAGQEHAPVTWWHVPPFWQGQRCSHRGPCFPGGQGSLQLDRKKKTLLQFTIKCIYSLSLDSCPLFVR